MRSALPGLVSRFAEFFSLSPRELRTAVSQRVFATVTRLLRGHHVLTQTTLGRLVERLKARGHVVWAECDMTCPLAWKEILNTEARRINAVDEVQRELPSAARTSEEERAFAASDRVIVFSQWALDNLPQVIRAKAVVVPPVSVPPADRPIHYGDEELPIELIFVGQVSFRKGAHILMDALRDAPLDTVTCHAFGSLPDNFRDYMGRTGMIVPECMQLHGAGDWRAFVRDRPARYVAVLPSFVEGSPRFVYEAASMGIPAIVSPAARPSFFEHDRDALVLSHPDVEQLKLAASRFGVEPSLWWRLSKSAYANYQREFDTASYGKRMAELLSEANE